MLDLPPEADPPESDFPHTEHALEALEAVLETPFVQRMARLYRLTPKEVWPVLTHEMVIPARCSSTGGTLIDSRLWHPTLGDHRSEFLWIHRCLGRALYNPARRLRHEESADEDAALREMRLSLPRDHPVGRHRPRPAAGDNEVGLPAVRLPPAEDRRLPSEARRGEFVGR